jgi:predicted MFS family arabinose efflux permease
VTTRSGSSGCATRRSIATVGAGMFGVFLFLTFYLQQNLGMAPLTTGLAFLPMMAVIMPVGGVAQTRLLPRYGARVLISAGMVLSAVAMVMLTGLTASSTYAADVLPPLLVVGLGMGLVFGPAMAQATAGVQAEDAGVASALVNTGQQVGGSIGTAFLSTIAASGSSAIAGYTTAFWWSAGIFAVGALLAWALLPGGAPQVDPAAEPVFAH